MFLVNILLYIRIKEKNPSARKHFLGTYCDSGSVLHAWNTVINGDDKGRKKILITKLHRENIDYKVMI